MYGAFFVRKRDGAWLMGPTGYSSAMDAKFGAAKNGARAGLRPEVWDLVVLKQPIEPQGRQLRDPIECQAARAE